MCKYENWLHQEKGDIRRETVEREVRRRRKKQDWRENSRTLYESITSGLAEALPDQRAGSLPPWKAGILSRIILCLAGIVGRVLTQWCAD